MNSKVSIIVPIYNAARYLPICLDSILSQTYRNLEIILVDDGSIDDSLIIIGKYILKDTRIRVISQKNSGVSTARNKGIEASTGEWICFADADDILREDYVEYLLELAIQNKTNVAVTTEMFTTFGGKQTLVDKINVVSGEQAVAAILYYNIPIGVYCKMFRRSFLGKDIRFLPDVYIGEGFNFNIQAFLNADKVAIGHRKIYCYRRDNSESAMTKFSLSKCKMALKAIKIIEESLTIKSDKLIKACKFAYWHTSGDMYNWMVLAKAKKQYPSMYHQCYSIVRSYAYKALLAPLNRKERFKVCVQFIHPRLLATMLEVRRLKIKKNK
jgi:glycosyltransferase involved in cell wall biosynthesis